MYCIYRITNKINGHTYIGQHKYIDQSNPMGKYKGSGKNLWLAYKKYGFDNFETETLYSRIRDKSTVDAMEIWTISKYKPEYNIAKGGTGGIVWKDESPMKGRKHSEEARAKMRASSRHDSNRHELNVYYWNAYTKMYLDIYRHHSKTFNKHRFRRSSFDVYTNEWLKIYKHHSAKRVRSELSKQLGKLKTTKGKHWFNNGRVNVMTFECPEGFVPGYIASDKQKAIWKSKEFKDRVSKIAKARWERENFSR